ncbi:SDR family oxidoreductase [Altererythrobacter indicus]|uniref:SDR family oxidoreductase n=1 Tax=Altericroceibacterium indicum TaxID=374177 RepID=A0A845AAG7_9SPHN|nr:SDR family oxidoreductase [Altericroceibacterium indicum]MXP26253.1 SDR family oxidoreductase [Altericroceibacterium indicum]
MDQAPSTKQAQYPSLLDRKVIITGGASGIGEGLVEGFAAQGANVGFIDIQGSESHALVERLSGARSAPVFEQCDITNNAALELSLTRLMKTLGGCDILINNAGNDDRHSVQDVTSDYWDERMAVNLKHQFFAAKIVAPIMDEAGGGCIINLGSISWHLGLSDLVIYQTAKAAIEGLTRSLARELGRKAIRVNAIIPGNVQTPRQMQWYSPEGEQEIVDGQCLNGRIQPADIAAMALFLASDDARFCTGHNYWVDAGWR